MLDDMALRSRLSIGALKRARSEFDAARLFNEVEGVLRDAAGEGRD
jgi:hypothetical protein